MEGKIRKVARTAVDLVELVRCIAEDHRALALAVDCVLRVGHMPGWTRIDEVVCGRDAGVFTLGLAGSDCIDQLGERLLLAAEFSQFGCDVGDGTACLVIVFLEVLAGLHGIEFLREGINLFGECCTLCLRCIRTCGFLDNGRGCGRRSESAGRCNGAGREGKGNGGL